MYRGWICLDCYEKWVCESYPTYCPNCYGDAFEPAPFEDGEVKGDVPTVSYYAAKLLYLPLFAQLGIIVALGVIGIVCLVGLLAVVLPIVV